MPEIATAIRRRHDFPEPGEAFFVTAVSTAVVTLSPRCRLCPLVTVPAVLVSSPSPRLSLAPFELASVAPEHVGMFLRLQGGQQAP